MIEAGAIFFVLVVSLGVYLFARFGGRPSIHDHPAGELDHLCQHREVLRKKLARGQRERWDGVMMQQLVHRLEETERQIATKTPTAPKPGPG